MPASPLTMTLWHNPRCSKSRGALALLQERGVHVVERRYLEQPPTVRELETLAASLRREPWQLVRFKESEAETLRMTEWPQEPAHRERWFEALEGHPRLLERPIAVTADGRAVVGRPPETVLDLL